MKQHTDEITPILIWTRFSLVNKNISAEGWQIGRGVETEKYIRCVVEDERRLRPRAEIFFGHTLPNIEAAAKSNRGIRHVVAASNRLPGWLLGRLDEAAAKYAWFNLYKVGYEDDWDWRAAVQPTLLSIGRECLQDVFLVASCRLDDDDGACAGVLRRHRRLHQAGVQGLLCFFTRGFCGVWDETEGFYEAFFTWKFPMNAMGLSYIGEFDVRQMKWTTPHWAVPGAHEQVDERVPTILDGRRQLFIRSLHGSNDVAAKVEASSKRRLLTLPRLFRRAPKDNIRKTLKKCQPADTSEIRDIFVAI